MGLARTTVFAGCLLLFLIVNASGNKCTVGCHGMHGGKAYQEGHTYVYDLEGTSVTSVPDSPDEATLKLKGSVELSVKPDCIRQLRLKGVQINGAPISLPDVEQYALQFNYHDGHVDTEVCAEAGDSQASLNIKRAVTSLFQSAVIQDTGYTTHHETDVFGGCPTDFSFHKDGDSLIIHKERNLARCSHRENIREGVVSAAFDLKSDIHSAPLLDSHQKIEQRFKRGVLNKAISVETYKLKPFSNGDIGAKTVIQTTLTLKSDKGDSPNAAVSLPKSLIFEAPHPVTKSSVDSIVTALKAVSAEVTNAVKPHAAEKFSELVKVLRLSNKNDLLAVYQKVRTGADFDKVKDKKIYLDALFRAGSGEAAEVAIDLMKGHELDKTQSLMFYASLPFVKHVNLPSVTAITSLLDEKNLPRLGYLGVGQVIGKYCQEHNCENVAEVKQAIHKIREKIGNGKTKTREQENVIVAALKALGNAKYLDDATLQKMASIAEDKNVRNRVRVAAIEALPGKCSMKWKQGILKVLGDHEEDSEIRIKSYLSLVACPCPQVANNIKEILDKEKINQVGSFMQSHLRNLRASADPSKAEAKRQFGMIKPRNKFPEDFRKYSFNNELSYHLTSVGVGSAMESNVIYSQDSFVPRSMNLNLTTEIFGRSFNFFELNTRIENLDRLLEHYFGPKGRLMQHEMEDLLVKGADDTVGIVKYIKNKVEKLREKREVKQGELDKFAKNVKLRNNEVDDNLDVDLAVKLFGVELGYITYNSDIGHVKPEQVIDKIFETLETGMNKAKKFDHNLQSHIQFLNAELIYPTNLGTALSLSVDGSSVVHVKLYSKVDIPAILKHPEKADVRVGLEPSAAIRVAGSMMVTGFDVDSGMKVVSTLHTDTATEVSVKMLDGKGFELSIISPKKNEEMINVNSEVLMSSGQKGDTYKAPRFSKGKVYSDCFEQFSSLIGVTLCGHLSFPYDSVESMQKKALFPLNGPAKFSVSWENTDVSAHTLKVYHDKSPKSRSFEITYDTPNSKMNRKVSLLAEAGVEPNKHAKISFDSPIKKASIEGTLKHTADEHTLTVMVNNDQQEYYARAGLLANGGKYKPVLEYKVPEHIEKLAGAQSGGKAQQYNMQGDVEILDQDGGKKYVFNKVTLVANDHPIVGLDGHVLQMKNGAGLDMTLNYGDESLALKMEGKKLGEKHYSAGLSAVPSKDLNNAFDLKWQYQRTTETLDNKLVLTHGPDLKSDVNRFTLEQHIVYKPKEADSDYVLGASNKITYPAMKMLLNLEGKVTPKSINGDVKVAYNKFKVGAEMSAKRDMATPGDYEVDVKAEFMQNSIKLESKRTIVEPHKSKFKNSIELVPGGKYEADAMVVYNQEKNKLNFEVDSDLNLNGKKVKAVSSLNIEPANLLSRVFVTVADVKYIDFLLKLRQGVNPQGSLTLNLKDYLTAGGQISFQNDKGNANLNIDLPKFNRKIKGTGDLVVVGTLHTANLELLYDAEKDPKKRIKLSTVTDLKKGAIDTKNVIEVLDNKMEVNAKGKLDGTLMEGELNADADVTLPNGRYMVYKVKRTSKKNDNKYTVHVNVDLTDHVTKGGASRKLTYTANAKNVDMKERTFESDSHLEYIDFNGDSHKFDAILKNLMNTDGYKKLHEADVKLSGARLPRAISLQYKNGKLDNDELTTNLGAAMGKELNLKASTHYIPGDHVDKPCKTNGDVELIMPFEKLRNVKLNVDIEMLHNKEKGVMDNKLSMDLTYNDDKTIKMESDQKLSGMHDHHYHEGDYKLTLTILKMPTIAVQNSFKYEPHAENEKAKLSHNTRVAYGEKEVKLAVDSLTFTRDLSFVNVNAKLTTPFEKLHNVDITLNHEGKSHRVTDITVNADNSKYILKTEIQESNTSPMIHIIFSCPHGKSEVLSKIEKLGEKEYKGEWKVETPYGFTVADAHVNLDSFDDFVINVNFDSDKIKHRKIHAEIANKPTAKTGRRIVVTVTSDGKNLVSGSTNYKRRDEPGKITIEGNGNLKVGEDTRSSSFKYTRQELVRETDGEIGVVMVLNAKFDPVAIVGELKVSNKEMLLSNSYCEQSKDCAHFKLQSTYDTDHKNYLKHQITVEVDLKKFNIPVEYGLKTNTEYKELMFDHSANLYLHSSKDKSEYTYHVYAQPKESAVILTLPSREMAVIGTFDMPKNKQTGAYKMDLSLYLDRKNKPSEKTSLISAGDINIEKDSLSLNGEMKFVYPSQPKDMVVKGRLHHGGEHWLDANVDIDIFAKKTQKISVIAKVQRQQLNKGYNLTSVIEVNSRGQQLKVDLKSHAALSQDQIGFGTFLSYTDEHQKPKRVGGHFALDRTMMHMHVISHNKQLVKVDTKLQLEKNLQKIDTEIALLDQVTVYNVEVRDWNTFKLDKHSNDKADMPLSANGRIIPGQVAELNAEMTKDGAKKDLLHVLVHLNEEKFLKPELNYNKDNIMKLMDYYKDVNVQLLKQLKEAAADVATEVETELKDLVEHLKKAQPNIKPLLEYYQTELNKLKETILSDQTIKDIQATLETHFGEIIAAVMDTMKLITDRLLELQKKYQEIVNNAAEAVKSITPQLKESFNKIVHVVVEMMNTTLNVTMHMLKALVAVINEHQKELKELATMAMELAQGIAKVIFKSASQIRKDVDEFVEMLTAQLKTLQIYELGKERYQELLKLQIPEGLLQSIDELSNIFKSMLPTEELRQLHTAVYDYIIKHVRRQKVDNAVEIKKIYGLAIDAVRSLVLFVESQVNLDNLYSLLQTRVSFDFDTLAKLPGIPMLKISLFNLLRNHELPTPLDMYYAYRPTLRASDIVPPFSKLGTVVDGGHIFAFDGSHFSMPGDCSYILAQDMQDGNFSVVANFNKGNLISVTLTEPKESITIKNSGNILVNNKPADFPANTKNLYAYLVVPTAYIVSEYGVRVTCGYKTSMICNVRVSGFYHGKLRGLLGDGNNERYDDYALPSGKITESETEFANAYKVKSDCPTVNAIDHKTQEHNPACTEYFSGEMSSMKRCFNYINPVHYREACDIGASKNPQAPCLIAAAYYSACYYKRVWGIKTPPACASCKVGEQTIAIGDSFSVKIPKKQADIILVVEQDTQNEKVFKDLLEVGQLTNDLKEELKQHGITDVHIGLVGYGDKMKWPKHYTVNGNLNIDSDVKNMKFEKTDPIITLQEAKKGDLQKQLEYLGQRLDVEFGTFKLTDAYEEAIHYPFRAGAAKAIVAVVANPCEKSPLPLSLQHLRLLKAQQVYRDLGMTYYHIYYTGDIQVDGKSQKNIVGYDHDNVYVLGDSKKKPLSGSTELRNNMALSTPDVCANFALKSGGAAFSSNNLIDAKPNQKRQFAQVTAKRIVESLVATEIEEDCMCVQDHGYVGHTHCKIVGRKEKEQKQTKAGVKG